MQADHSDAVLRLAVLAVFQQLQLDVMRARLDRTPFPSNAADQQRYVRSALDHIFMLLRDVVRVTEAKYTELTMELQQMVFGPRAGRAMDRSDGARA